MLFGLCSCGRTSGVPSGETGRDDGKAADNVAAETARLWIEDRIGKDALFSFRYGSLSFGEIVSRAEKKTGKSEDGNGNTVYTVEYLFDGVKATCTALLYGNSAAVDWVCGFENTGNADSQPITDIYAADTVVDITDAEVNYANGSNGRADDFSLMSKKLTGDAALELSSAGGRSSQGHMPYFDILGSDSGVIAALGWTGQWTASVKREGNSVRIRAGMTKTDIALHAGESMRTPSFVLTFFEGGADAGHNAFRRLILNEYTPSDGDGKKLRYLPLTINNWGSSGTEKLLATVETAKRFGV